MKAMILAAGRGERLRPLTDRVPKPLIEAGGKPLIGWHLERLAAAGCRDVVINVSHLGERIVERLGDGAGYGVRIAFSREPQPLETAGGMAMARTLLGAEPFLVVNGDVYCEVDLSRLMRVTLDERLAHLVLVPNPAHHLAGDFTLDAGKVGNAASPRYTYAGIAVIAPRLFAGVEAGSKAQLAPLLRAAAERRLVGGELFEGTWLDVGTVERLAALEAYLAMKYARG
ncbi:MAG: N-acetyl-alpha-D-muramate 1-phosphate uridylyltransferase [Betaproteobacteria bacterium]|jgi:MurNAc alpha-1-phosphate uridylyltransferase|nr:N-acetyl-alpha-D-muramate 1-phosphate uridylyltransferase [Betaproteobacteria bacterium]